MNSSARDRIVSLRAGASLGTILLLGLAATTGAHAQSVPPLPSTAPEAEADAPAEPQGVNTAQTADNAGEATAREGDVNDIIITAQRRAERLQTVPIAATVVTGEAWRNAMNFSVEDLEKISPSLTFDTTTSTRNNSVRIRGIGTNTTSSGIEPSTSTVIDGVALIRAGQSSGSLLLDLERIEVLRGPQGTLFGKNASAGVVNITTRAPTKQFEFSADALATNDEEYQVRAAISGPLTDAVSARLSTFYRDYDGNVLNVFNGERLNANESVGVRGKILVDPVPDFSFLLTADYGKTDSSCCGRVLRNLDFASSPKAAVEGARLGFTPGPENRLVNNDVRAIDDHESFLVSGEANKNFGDFTFTSISAYQWFNISQQLDDDQTSTAPSATGQQSKQRITSDETVDGFSQEFRLTSPSWNALDFVAGLYFMQADVNQTSTNFRSRIPAPQEQQSTFDSLTRFTNYAAFGQVNFHPLDRVTLLLGGRYTIDKVKNLYVRRDDPRAPLRGGNVTLVRDVEEKDFSWKAGAEFEATDDLFFYGTYAQGYKGPGFSIASDARATNPVVQPETAESYEVGAKLRLLDRRLALNIAAFDATYENYAVTVFFEATRSTQLVNAAELRTRGIELDFDFRPFENFSIAGGVAYVDAGIDVLRTPCFPQQTEAQGCVLVPGTTNVRAQDVRGGELPNSPDWKYNVGAVYTLENDALPVNLIFRANYAYTGRQQFQLNQWPRSIYDGYGIIDASVAVASKDDRYRAEIFVKNLGDRFYINNIAGVSELTGSTLHFVPRDAERYFGARLSFRY